MRSKMWKSVPGAGARTLDLALAEAHYVLIGEDHGIAQIPAFCSAIFDALAPRGFKTLVVDVGPTQPADGGARPEPRLDRRTRSVVKGSRTRVPRRRTMAEILNGVPLARPRAHS